MFNVKQKRKWLVLIILILVILFISYVVVSFSSVGAFSNAEGIYVNNGGTCQLTLYKSTASLVYRTSEEKYDGSYSFEKNDEIIVISTSDFTFHFVPLKRGAYFFNEASLYLWKVD